MGEVIQFPMNRIYDVLPIELIQWDEQDDFWFGTVEADTIYENGFTFSEHFVVDDCKFDLFCTLITLTPYGVEVDGWDYITEKDNIAVRVLNND